jgi:hypothetical protein
MFDRYYLRRFLRARQHDLKRAQAMFLAHLKWREDNGIDTILTDFHFEASGAAVTRLYAQACPCTATAPGRAVLACPSH